MSSKDTTALRIYFVTFYVPNEEGVVADAPKKIWVSNFITAFRKKDARRAIRNAFPTASNIQISFTTTTSKDPKKSYGPTRALESIQNPRST